MDNMNRAKKIKLLTNTYTVDSIGQRIPTVTEKPVFALIWSASQSEFFNSGEHGLKPDKVFDVLITEYEGQTEISYAGNTYTVYRTYERDDGRVELHTEKRVGD